MQVNKRILKWRPFWNKVYYFDNEKVRKVMSDIDENGSLPLLRSTERSSYWVIEGNSTFPWDTNFIWFSKKKIFRDVFSMLVHVLSFEWCI